MGLETLTETARPSTVGTFTSSDNLTEQYTTTAVTGGGATTKSLNIKYYWPVVDDHTEPRPIVFLVALGAWSTSNYTIFSTEAGYLNGMGVHCAVLDVRISTDDPLSDGDNASHSSLRRAIRAAVFDLDVAVKYTLANHLENADWTIEPSMMFFGGSSAGGITSLLYPQFFPTRPVAGLCPVSVGFGASTGSSPNTATDIIRDQLKYTEVHFRTSGLTFLGGADTTIGTTYIDSYRAKQASIGGSIVHYDADGTHVPYSTFDTSALTGATSMAGAFYNYLSTRCATLPSTATLRQGGSRWERSWLNQQSRFW